MRAQEPRALPCQHTRKTIKEREEGCQLGCRFVCDGHNNRHKQMKPLELRTLSEFVSVQLHASVAASGTRLGALQKGKVMRGRGGNEGGGSRRGLTSWLNSTEET